MEYEKKREDYEKKPKNYQKKQKFGGRKAEKRKREERKLQKENHEKNKKSRSAVNFTSGFPEIHAGVGLNLFISRFGWRKFEKK